MKTCAKPGCPQLTNATFCDAHLAESRAKHDAGRPSASERGYGHSWRTIIRPGFLRRHPVCVLCGEQATVPDHWPAKRRALVAAGVRDPDADHRMRPLCTSCHNSETAKYAHRPPGGHH